MSITDPTTQRPPALPNGHEPPPAGTPNEILLAQMEECLAEIRRHGDGMLAELRSFGRLMLGAPNEPGHHHTPAERIPRLTQVLHEDGWWNVAEIAQDEDGVTLTLTRVGFAPLELKVDHGHLFEAAEIF